MKTMKKYLLWFANEGAEFRKAEIDAVVSILKSSIKWSEKPNGTPFWIVEVSSEDIVHQITNRSVTLKHVTELWAHGKTIDELHKKLKIYMDECLHDESIKKDVTFKFDVKVYCNKQTLAEKIDKIESFSYLPFKGNVNLKNPDIILQYFEYYGSDSNNVPEKPYDYFFGRLVSYAKRRAVHDLSLKKRVFIGNTSMDAELSLIMANLAKVSKGDLILDPFVGSGSLLVAAAYYGAYVMGVDINFLMLHGKTKPTRVGTKHVARCGENVLANMRQYGFRNQYIDVVVGDSSMPIWKTNVIFDAIITDPPYGIREAAEKVGSNKTPKPLKNIDITDQYVHFPSKVDYEFHQIMRDLLHFSALHLKVGGRLVTWIPVFRLDSNKDEYLPQHSCFKLISNCEQILSLIVARRLLTYEKFKELKAEEDHLSRDLDRNFIDKYMDYRSKRRMSTKHQQNQCSNNCIA